MKYDPFAVARVELAGLEAQFDESEGQERQYAMTRHNALLRTIVM